MTQKIIVGLGPVPTNLAAQQLGEDFVFVENPTLDQLNMAEGAILRAEYFLGEKELASMPNLKVVARTGVGVDRVDVDAATSKNVAVLITPGSNSAAVAEGTMAQLLHLSKKLGILTELVRQERWMEREQIAVGDLDGATLGLVGFGRIGRRVAELAEAFGMKILAFDPMANVPEQYAVDSLAQLLGQAGYLSIHSPLTPETRNLIDKAAIDLLPQGAIIVNCSRGGIVDLDAAHDGLLSGKLAGLGLDSFDPEPATWHKVFDLPNVVLTPHVMGLSEKAKQQTFIAAATAVRNYLQGSPDYTAVNTVSKGK